MNVICFHNPDEEIAGSLNLSAWTVRKQVKNMLEKTGFKSRTQLAIAIVGICIVAVGVILLLIFGIVKIIRRRR